MDLQELIIDGERWVTTLGAKLLLAKKDAADATLSRSSVYYFADKYNWRTIKIGNTRLYHRGDVLRTPNRLERWQLGGDDWRASGRTNKKRGDK